ncbi:MAG: ABC transporter ATP-binding protein [Chitinophagaceae bacterium]|nr:MAG: ABC transporter ATP-binding protein [Chitinophagaceae bacterium]
MKSARRSWNLLEPAERRRYLWLSLGDGLIQVLDVVFLAALLALVQRLLQGGADRLPVAPAILLPLFFLACVGKNTAGYLVTKSLHLLAGRVAQRLAIRQLEGCQAEQQVRFIETDSSVFIRKVNFHPLEFAHYILLGCQQIATQLLLIVLSISAVLFFDPGLFLLLVGMLAPPAFLLFRSIKQRIDNRKDLVKTSNEDSLRYLIDALKGQPEGKVYGAQHFFRSRYATARKRFTSAYFEMMGLQQLPARALETVAVLGLLLLLGFSLQSGAGGNYLLLRAGAFLAAAYKIIPGLVKLIGAHSQLRAWSFTLDELPQQAPAIKPVRAIQSLEAEDLGFAYGTKALFEGVSFTAESGDILLIESPSGSGKTTLLQVLLGLQQPVTGTVRVNDKLRTAANTASYWPKMAYVRQQAFLIHDTIEKNITLEEHTLDPERLQQLLLATGLTRMLEAEKSGPDKIVLENGANLSGGQQQRIALARALYRAPDLYFLDEPFNELDATAIVALQALLEGEAAAGKIVILVTHQALNIRGARRIHLHESAPQHTRIDHARLRIVGS